MEPVVKGDNVHPEFADWCRVASIESSEADLDSLWASTEVLAKKLTADDLLDTARTFYGLSTADPGFPERLAAALKGGADKTTAPTRLELQILSGAALVSLLETPGKGVVSALALACGSYCGVRDAPVADIVRCAHEHLSSASAKLRRPLRTELPESSQFETATAAAVDALRKALQPGGAPPTWSEPLTKAFDPLQQALSALLRWAGDQETKHSLRAEETDVLWWLFSERTRDARLPFEELKVPAIVLVAARDLADLTRTLPGPFAARAFLEKAVRARATPDTSRAKQTVSLADAVSACPPEWRSTAVSARAEIEALGDLCPTCFALRKAVEADGKKSWQTVFANLTGLKPTSRIDPVDLSFQSYCEWLLVRATRTLRAVK